MTKASIVFRLAYQKSGKVVVDCGFDAALYFDQGKANVTRDCEKGVGVALSGTTEVQLYGE